MEAVRRSRGLALMLFTALSSAAVAQPASSPLSLSSATALALRQASAFRQAQIDERLAAEDVKQARSALLPRARDAFSTTYNAPAHRPQGGVDPTVPSFIAANATATP